MQVELILGHQAPIVLLLDEVSDLVLRIKDAEVQIAKDHLDVVILDLVAVVLSAPFTFIDHLCDLIQLLMPLFHVPRVIPSAKMAIHEDK